MSGYRRVPDPPARMMPFIQSLPKSVNGKINPFSNVPD